MTVRNVQQQEYWDALAPDWIAAQSDHRSIGTWFGERVLEHLAVTPGEYAVDIGCGTGDTTVALARAAAPGGRAVGVDISAALLDEARRRAAAVTDADVSFVVADAEDAPVAEDADVIFSRFGVMFFADPALAFSNLCASLRPGGRFAVAVWQEVFSNDWMLLPGIAALTVTGSLPPMPGDGEPGPLSLADADHLRALLTGAGFENVEVRPLEYQLVIQRDDVEGFVRRSLAVGAAREAIRASGDDPAVATAIGDQLRQDLLARIGDADSTSLSAAAWLAAATR